MGTFHISEVQFYFRSNEEHTYALVLVWSEPDLDLLQASSNTVYLCVYQGQTDLQVIDVKTIMSVVAMVPMTPRDGDCSSRFFLLEKPGLEIMGLGDVSIDVANE
jgi:hypothetical protein